MNRSVAVFDFDKTLTDRDTLFGFYKTVAGNERLFFPKRILLLGAGLLYKFGLVSNDTLKCIGISLFLKGRTRDELESAARRYSEKIKLNDIYSNHYQKKEGEKWIVSASPEIYLRQLFPGKHVAGTTFTYSGDKVIGLDVNMFGMEKKKFLKENGIFRISELYTDSFTDKYLMDLADKVYLVRNGEVKLLNPEKPFKSVR